MWNNRILKYCHNAKRISQVPSTLVPVTYLDSWSEILILSPFWSLLKQALFFESTKALAKKLHVPKTKTTITLECELVEWWIERWLLNWETRVQILAQPKNSSVKKWLSRGPYKAPFIWINALSLIIGYVLTHGQKPGTLASQSWQFVN